MKASIIFHSVRGNNYLMAKRFHESLQKNGVESDLYRVADDDIEIWKSKFKSAEEFYNEIKAIPMATPDLLPDKDLIIMGGPTYFTNMSAEMKFFIDSTAIFYTSGVLSGKYFACFSSSSDIEGGAVGCLQCMINYALSMGMQPISVPIGTRLKTGAQVYGIIQNSGPLSEARPGENVMAAIDMFCEHLASLE